MVPALNDGGWVGGMPCANNVRVNVFNETFLNENEHDANSVLTELDKGLRSCKSCVQCEAIVRFPRLFEKYPFPILINSSFLKLAEFFLNGSNLLRFWVLRVCQQSENHLDKILNIDAFVKRIFMVIHSNDPVARALTLRTLGAVSRVIPEKQQVHHALRRALDSHDTPEVEAAIYASGQFASQSRSFAISMCSKISDMIESLQIPVPMKLQLIPVLRYMHHDAKTAKLVRKLCLNLLPKYPAQSFVIAILVSLSELSARTMTDVGEQVQLLLSFMKDIRKTVRIQALHSLTTLADERCVHAWNQDMLKDIIMTAYHCTDYTEQFLILSVIYKLCNNALYCQQLLLEPKQQKTIIELCNVWIQSNSYHTTKETLTVLATIAINIEENNDHLINGGNNCCYHNAMKLINDSLYGLLMTTLYYERSSNDLRQIIMYSLRIANMKLEFAIQLAKILCDLLMKFENYSTIDIILIICEALAVLTSLFQLKRFTLIGEERKEQQQQQQQQQQQPKPSSSSSLFLSSSNRYKFQNRNGFNMNTDHNKRGTSSNKDKDYVLKTNPVLKDIPLILKHVIYNKERQKITSNEYSRIIEILSAIALQASMGTFLTAEFVILFKKVIDYSNIWTQYRIARSASRYGQHYLAAYIYLNIVQQTTMDRFHFFLTGMADIAQIECLLNYGVTFDDLHENYEHYENIILNGNGTRSYPIIPLMQRLEMATDLYWQSISNIRAISSPTNPFIFQLEFLRLRAQLIQTLHSTVTIKMAQIIVPPPAIACSLAQNSRDYLQKFGHVTNQLRKLVKELKSCEESFARLYKSSFDADPNTLEFLEIVQYQCTLFASIIERICYATPSDEPELHCNGKTPENRYFIACCKRMLALCTNMPNESMTNKSISNYHLDVILAEVELIISTPLCMPRYFFQVQQSTQVKLSVSPQPRNDGKPVSVQSGSNLVIKVEGVIQHYGKRPSLFRSIDRVQLTLFAKLLTPRQQTNNDGGVFKSMMMGNDCVILTQTVKPQREFLTGNFLLPIANGGYWQVSLETFIIDESGRTWSTGPKSTMTVRVLDDPSNKTPNVSTPNIQVRRF